MERASVLIVEDFDDAREMYAAYLRFCGFRVLEARDGLEAVSVASRFRPDVIIMDLALPRLDGWEAASRIKADPAMDRTRIIALTAYSDAQSHTRALRAGCLMVCPKPCDPDELVRLISATLAGTALSQPASSSAAVTRQAGTERSS